MREGDLLTLSRGGLLAQPRVYDDIVEAVLDATAEQHRPWTPQDNARTALAASLTLPRHLRRVPRRRPLARRRRVRRGRRRDRPPRRRRRGRTARPGRGGSGLALAAAVFGGVAGYLAVPAGSALWGWPLAAAGLGAAIVGPRRSPSLPSDPSTS
ncbi:MAG: hypothetical protein U0Q04_03490 [Microbacterium sp.]